MRNVVAGLLFGALILGAGAPARAQCVGQCEASEVGLSFAAAASNLVYFPAKLTVAAFGLVAGGINGFLTGGDTRAAYAVWVPTATGTFLLTPRNFDGTEPIQFFGTDWADRPSTASRENDGSRIYDAGYMSR
jgi:hypothetical protein